MKSSGPLFTRTAFATLATLASFAAAGCYSTHTPQAVLFDPGAAEWSAHAPARFAAVFETSKGSFTLEVVRALSPLGADRFYNLARTGFFDDSRFFRTLPNYIAQFGIPGNPAVTSVWKDRTFPDDSVHTSNVRGTFAFAMTGPNTRTTQLYISLKDNPQLDAQGFSPLGRVVDGMNVVDALYSGYGENAGGGVRAGKQQRMLTEGNKHLDKDFPLLDRIFKVTVRTR